jgi:hypothetical protein
MNGVEDPRVDGWMARRFPGVRAWQRQVFINRSGETAGVPWLLLFVVGCAVEAEVGFVVPTDFPEAVRAALDETRPARIAYAAEAPPTDGHVPVPPEVRARWRDEVLPLRPGLRWLPAPSEQRVQLSALDALKLVQAHVFPVAARLLERDRRHLAGWLASAAAHARAGRDALDGGDPDRVVAIGMMAPEARGVPPEWADRMANDLLEAHLERRSGPPLVGASVPSGHPARPGTPGGDVPRPPRYVPASAYDRDLAEVADQVEALVAHLEEVLLPRRRLRERAGHPTGRRVDIRRAMAFEADPRRYNELWARATIPDRKEAAIALLVDLSGSMSGDKARSALLGTILVAETLQRVGVAFAIDGFQDVLIPLHAFGDPFGSDARQRIAGIPQEVAGSRPGGNNRPGYNDDGPCLKEAAERLLAWPSAERVLIVVSDGLPEGSRSNAADLTAAVAALSKPEVGLRLIGLGLGPGTGHVRDFYKESTADVPVQDFARTIGALIESVVLRGQGW